MGERVDSDARYLASRLSAPSGRFSFLSKKTLPHPPQHLDGAGWVDSNPGQQHQKTDMLAMSYGGIPETRQLKLGLLKGNETRGIF